MSVKVPPPLRILLVEDSEHDRLVFRRAFKKGQVPVQITAYARAEKALAQLEADATPFDLVVTDYKLPGMSGLDLCKELLDCELPLPLVMLTGTGTEYLAVEALKVGVDDYIIKDPSRGYLELLPVVLPDVVRKHGDRLARKRAEAALRQLNHNLFLLNRVGQELTTTLDQFQITEQLLQVIREIVGAEGASVWLWEEEQASQSSHRDAPQLPKDAFQGDAPQPPRDAAQPPRDAAQDWLVCRAASSHDQGGSPLNLRLRPGQGVVGWVAQNGKSVIVPRTLDDARFSPGIDEQTGFRTHSLLVAPLWVRGRVIGALEAVNKLKGDSIPGQGDSVPGQGDFDEQDMTLLETLAASAAVAIDNAGLVEALQGRTIELQARNEDLNAYAHTVAHDLKGPLAHMIGFAQVLEQDHAELPAKELSRHLHTISQSGRKMNNIIDELLLLAGLREAEIELDSLDTASIVDGALERLAYMVEERQAQILLPESWPVALGHGAWVEEVWVNYLSNAIKYGGSPPRIELGFDVVDTIVPGAEPTCPGGRCQGLAPARSAGGSGSGQWSMDSDRSPPTTIHYPLIRFWVRDNGPGLTPEEQGRLFKSFERLDRMRAKGHGLGLSIVRRIVEKLGGEVGVESEVGRGSVFWFTLRGKS